MDKEDTLNRLKLRRGNVDADIKDEAEAHKHYKEMAENIHAIMGAVTYTEIMYDDMSDDEGRHLQNNIKIRKWIDDQLARLQSGVQD